MSEIKKILVIGGTGFIGSYLVNNLATRPGSQLNVVCYGDLSLENKLPNVNYHQIDLTKASDEFNELVDRSDCIVSLATPNSELIKNLIDSVNLAGSKKIVYTSTLLVYPDSDRVHSEDVKPSPETEYEKNKVEEEKLLTNLAKSGKSKVSIARLGNVYGNVKNRGLVNHIMLALKNNLPLTINGQGGHRRNYIFVQDVADLLEFLIFHDQQSEIDFYNICSDVSHTINEVVTEAERISGQKINKIYGEPIKEKFSVTGSNKKLTEISGRKPKYDLSSGLQQAYNNYFKHT